MRVAQCCRLGVWPGPARPARPGVGIWGCGGARCLLIAPHARGTLEALLGLCKSMRWGSCGGAAGGATPPEPCAAPLRPWPSGAVATQCPGLQEGVLGAAPPFPSEVSLGEPRGPHGRDCSYSGASCLGSGCDSGQKRCEPGLPQRWAARGAAGGKVSRHTVALLQELLGGKSFPVVLCPFSPYPPSGQ